MSMRTPITLLAATSLTLTAGVASAFEPSESVEFIAPANPGGGWDTLVRTSSRVIQEEGLADEEFAPINTPGGGGAVAWSQIAKREGDAHTLFATSPPIILVPLTESSRYDHNDFTPIARLSTDYATVLVADDSDYEDINDLLDAMEEDPGLSVGGGSAPGSMDHIAMAGLADAAGLDASSVNYVPFSGGGDAMTNLMGGHVEAVVTGAGEAVGQIEDDDSDVRALGVSSSDRLGGSLGDVATFEEQGVDYTFDIWRGVMGPPDMPEDAVTYYQDLFKEMLETDRWAEERDKLGWIDAYQGSEEFGEFLDSQADEFSGILGELGLLDEES
ncbi:Bug family tripartite tricarboxylate transporter substrate binding protein [Aidingimonas halophila]|uniref:Putative tricarboxylic transport membrane protein n=1 Tax=Aidingimonas halophila TaxID=574349 RepID=A0A1H3DBF4_9GAMM|nr:tripartite tricarboxylate transporter substrate-binding protein [Aidingimonas halophila]GHC30227.1 tricarboxylic transport TctC [Aidingimonas halophila]SDX63640.1 putative tricarboxylic transport membrane protein [Aidingimonas halophila]